MSNSDNFLKSCGNAVLKSVVTVLILIAFVSLFILICLPIYLWRIFVYLIARLIRKDLDKMLTPQSSIMANDDLYTSPKGTFVTKFLLDGEVSRMELESRLQSAIQNEKFSVLSQTLENWMGFYFWKRCDENNNPFQFKDNIEFFEENLSIDEIKEIHTSLVDKPFKKDQPLWECIVYNNVKPEKETRNERQSVIFFRVHQSLADGTSFFSIFDELKMIPEHQIILNLIMGNNKSLMSWKEKVKFGFRVCAIGPYNMVRCWVESMTQNQNEKLSKAALMQKLEFNQQTTIIEEMYLANARRISMTHMAPTGALSLSLVTGVVRRLAEVADDGGSEATLPNAFKINCPMPIPFPADSISNYVAYIPVEGPIIVAEPITRLGTLLQSAGEMIFSTTPYTSFGLMVLVGLLNSSLTGYCARLLPLGTVILNIFPGSALRRKFLDKDVMAITVKSGCPSFLGGACCTFNSIMYKGELSLSMTYPKGLNMGDKILKEFELCQTNKSTNSGFFGMNLGNLLNALT